MRRARAIGSAMIIPLSGVYRVGERNLTELRLEMGELNLAIDRANEAMGIELETDTTIRALIFLEHIAAHVYRLPFQFIRDLPEPDFTTTIHSVRAALEAHAPDVLARLLTS